MSTVRLTLSKTDFVMGEDGKLRHKVLKEEAFDAAGHNVAKTKLPKWWDRFLELRAQGATYGDCADMLTAEGFTGNKGKRIQQNSLLSLVHYHTKKKHR